jgi:hypothetical protein
MRRMSKFAPGEFVRLWPPLPILDLHAIVVVTGGPSGAMLGRNGLTIGLSEIGSVAARVSPPRNDLRLAWQATHVDLQGIPKQE